MPEKDETARPKVSVVDRRHWAEPKDDGDAEAPSVLPTYIEQLEARARENEERLKTFVENQRAENEAFRERIRKEAGRRAEEALGGLVEELTGVLDNMDRALETGASGGPAALLEGVRLVHDRLYETLQAHGLERVESAGGPFDPNVHEAVGVVSVDDPAKENQVAEEVLPGYLLKGRLLRPARVRVGKPAGPPPEELKTGPPERERESS
ncbi:MAG: nucleotide exchange factor GrpE [Nitrospinota bacterium]|jgi:molecular chaperone GrpE|nr:nucleotide exchange factor GrpE [Nitrospinota bacterium]MDP6485015.1 nucleotide exchange factor GrpE [Nitrospinota bacterium]MDP6620484.1 nucleotide exchange factor GrpE [Nitrospinota bacterium]MDP7387182.1 nucleotide exchange factor GrpE [Nitrospinota bacterium]HJM43996.1 nucleotide exchange factor GrpE [Nitrospinota bacterium]